MQEIESGAVKMADINTGAGPSARIFARFYGLVTALFEDFINFFGLVTSTAGNFRGWKSYQDTSCTVLQTNEPGGVVALTLDGTDNAEIYLQAGGATGGPYKLTAGAGPKLGFECRFKAGQIVTQDIFIGLAIPGLNVSDGIFSDSDALAQKDLIGFHVLAGASASLTTCLCADGGAERTAVAAKTLVANTWYKVGFVYDPNAKKKLTWYVDGDEVDFITDDTIATFPTGVALTETIGLKAAAAAAKTLSADWTKTVQLAA